MEHANRHSKEPIEKMTKGEALVKYFLRRIRRKKEKRKCGNSYTIVGIIDKYLPEVSKRWDEPSTIRGYANHLFNLLLPALKEKKDAPINDIQKEDYDDAIEQIILDRKESGEPPYSDAYIAHFKYLFRIIVKVAYNHHHCLDCFWASEYEQLAELSEEEIVEQCLPKSLTAGQFARIIYPLLISPETMPGEWMGLLNMAALDFRDNEACAPKYGDIVPRAEITCVWVINTALKAKAFLKIGGKTPNAERAFPISEKHYEAIMKRKAHITRYIENNYDDVIRDHPEYSGKRPIEIVDLLPIVCRGDDYFTGISAARLSDAGRAFFQFIGFDKKEFYLADMASSSDLIISAGYDLKNPSSYLLRRDCATVMRILGLAEEDILFLMGHKIENSILSRNDFLNEPELIRMSSRLSQRPVLNTISSNRLSISSGNPLSCNYNIMPNDIINISTRPDEEMIVIVTAQEPGDGFSINVRDNRGKAIPVRIDESYITDIFTGPVNMIRQFQVNFIKAYDRIKRSKNAPHPSKYLFESAINVLPESGNNDDDISKEETDDNI